jgi:hypothetical protein
MGVPRSRFSILGSWPLFRGNGLGRYNPWKMYH